MSIILQPQAAFPIVRQIGNHLDSTTYYVRAVIRDADGTTIDTVNLAAKGGQRYQTAWQVPADPTGQGRYISIVTSVYTSSSYTTKSSDYSDEETTYLIFDRVLSTYKAGGGGADVDYYMIRKIIKEEIKKGAPEPVELPEQIDYSADLKEIKSAVKRCEDNIRKDLEDDTMPETDLTPVIDSIKALEASITSQVASKETDLTPITSLLDKVVSSVEAIKQMEAKDIGVEDLDSFKKDIDSKIEKTIGNAVKDELRGKFIGQFNTMLHMNHTPTKQEEDSIDINKLTS